MAHYYQRPEIQEIADHIGDSLALAQIAASTEADVIVLCGVNFMAETAKIFCPGKTVLCPAPRQAARWPTHARPPTSRSSYAAIRYGCDGYFGYPITPQSEVLETLEELMTWETTGMVVLQAESEVAAINMVYGAPRLPSPGAPRRHRFR